MTTQVQTALIADASVTTAKLVDGNVTPAKLSQPLTAGTAVASTSGTAILFSSIPSWAKRITVLFNGVSTSGTSFKQVQIGSGSILTTGYSSASGYTASNNTANAGAITTGFAIDAASFTGVAGNSISGSMIISSLGGNVWVASGSVGITGGTYQGTFTFGGTVTLSGALDRVNITTVNGTDTFDAGSINIFYE